MIEPFLETGDIIEVNKKQYLVLGIYDLEIKDSIRKERKTYVDEVLKNVENMKKIKPSNFYIARQNLYYYFMFYDSRTIREFLIRVFEQNNRLLLCEYSSYPVSIEPVFLFNLIGTRKKVGKVKEADVKVNLIKGALLNIFLAYICTTTEVYERVYNDVKSSKITKKQKDYLKNCVMKQLNFMSEQYDTAKRMFSTCIADVYVNKQHYLGYICFTKDHVNVLSVCNKNASLKKKVELLFDKNYPMFELDFKDVAKVEF